MHTQENLTALLARAQQGVTNRALTAVRAHLQTQPQGALSLPDLLPLAGADLVRLGAEDTLELVHHFQIRKYEGYQPRRAEETLSAEQALALLHLVETALRLAPAPDTDIQPA